MDFTKLANMRQSGYLQKQKLLKENHGTKACPSMGDDSLRLEPRRTLHSFSTAQHVGCISGSSGALSFF